MTQEDARKWYKEIKRWVKAPNGTEVWWRNEKETEWIRKDNVLFYNNMIYVVDDEWAELRKAQIDGKQLQKKVLNEHTWTNNILDEENMIYSSPSNWRIKPEIEFPVYRRHKIHGFIIRFDDYGTGTIVMSENKQVYMIGDSGDTWCPYNNERVWEPVETVEIDGVTYYDTQPVWAWDDGHIIKEIRFIDAKNKCFFDHWGYCNGERPDRVAPVKNIEDWMIEAWKKLKI